MNTWAPSTWTLIHYFCSKCDEERAQKTQKLMGHMLKLICCEECRRNAQGELKKYPMKKREDDMLQWSWELHNEINRRLRKKERTYSECKTQFSRGFAYYEQSFWRVIHSFAVTYTPDLADDYKSMVELMIELTPDPKWRNAMTKVYTEGDIDLYLKNNVSLFNWSWRFHDRVLTTMNIPRMESYGMSKTWYFSRLDKSYSPDGKCQSCSV